MGTLKKNLKKTLKKNLKKTLKKKKKKKKKKERRRMKKPSMKILLKIGSNSAKRTHAIGACACPAKKVMSRVLVTLIIIAFCALEIMGARQAPALPRMGATQCHRE